MYIVFLIALIAAILILTGRRNLGIATALLTTITLGALLMHHMTDKLPISL
jgi:hypothetical protein